MRNHRNIDNLGGKKGITNWRGYEGDGLGGCLVIAVLDKRVRN